MVRRKITIKPAAKILSTLAEKIEIEQYKLPKMTGFSYRTILRKLKALEKKGLIKIARTEPSKKGGKEKNIWTLTPEGLNHIYVKQILNLEKFLTHIPSFGTSPPEGLNHIHVKQPLDLEKFQNIASKHRGTLLFVDKIHEWCLNETPRLAVIILNKFGEVIFSNNYDSSELEQRVVQLLITVLFFDELETANENDILFSQDIFSENRSILDDNSVLIQLREETAVFLKNNPWVKLEIEKLVTSYIEYIERERVFISGFSETVKRRLQLIP